MKNKFLVMLLLAAMCMNLTACKSSDKKSDSNPQTNTESSTEAGSTTENTSGTLSFTAGTYTATATGNNGPVTVEVVFSETEIVSVEVKDNKETAGICDTPFTRIPEAIVSGQTLAVDTVTGATNSSNAVLTAVEDCVTQAGGDVEALKTASGESAELVVEEMTCDVVVVGAGAAGSAAALSASRAGANVIIIEKTSTPSGAGTIAGVLFATESDMQIAENKVVSTEWLYNQYIHDSSYFANARLVTTIIQNSSETVNWLVANGVNLRLLDAGHGSQYAHVGMPTTAHGYIDGGSVAINTLLDQATALGSEVLFETEGKELIFNEDGTVAGVIATTTDGRELHILADSVVLATGGFGGNAEMMAEVFGEKAGTALVTNNTGDGIQMAWSAGAAELGLDVAQWFGMKYGAEAKQMENSSALTELVRNPLLFVNNVGQRFGNEEEAYESAALGTMMYNQPDAEMYIIVTQDLIDEVAKVGLAEVFVDRWGHLYGQGLVYNEAGKDHDLDAMCEAWREPKDYTATIEDAVNCGVAFKANSVAELAEILGMEYLEEEVARYNEFCAAGEDLDFHKDPQFLDAVEDGNTIYAVKVKLRCLTTLGGVAINEDIQAVDESGVAIPNLYVAGADAGGMYGNNYVVFEGGTLGFAYTSGRLAGENAAANAELSK
ncbi:MAG: FAD-dependent oxidoreductase [Lachnospiraceae bacterium]|nr:FAD-dependent oxidoreductase [Lachnospiraceae bacterium]